MSRLDTPVSFRMRWDGGTGRRPKRAFAALAAPFLAAVIGLTALLLLLDSRLQAAEASVTAKPAGSLAAQPAVSQMVVFFVTADGVGSVCTEAIPCLLQTAANLAPDGSEIRVSAGLYDDLIVTAGHTQTLYLDTSVELRGGYTATNWAADPDPDTNVTILDGLNAGRVVYLEGAIAPTIEGFTIRNGRGPGGAGIFNASGSPAIRSNRIHGNIAPGAAGIGAAISDGGYATIIDNEIFDNDAEGQGGGIAVNNAGASATLIAYNRIYGNTAGGASFGGGVSIIAGSAIVQGNQIYQNSAGFGGGLINFSTAEVTVSSNILYQNSAATSGGALASQGDDLKFWNNTVVANSAGTGGGGLAFNGGSAEIRNTIVASNTAGVDSGIYLLSGAVTASHNNVHNNGVSAGVTLNNPIPGVPGFANLPAFDLHITAGSTNLINSGDATAPVTEDVDRQGRPFDGGMDVGADEFYDPANTCYARLNNGAVYTSIQTAVNQSSSPDDLIRVAGRCAGSLSQVVQLSTTLTLQGGYTLTDWVNQSHGPTVIDAQGASGRRGILISGGGPTVDSLHVTGGNLPAGNGAGIYISGGAGATVQNVVLFGNSASGSNGALGVTDGRNAALDFNTIADNSGAGAYFEGDGSIGSSIFYANSGFDINGGSGHLYNLTGTDPLFVNAAGGDYRLTAVSPAIDHGDPAATLDRDFEGDGRPAGNGFDAGVDEANSYPAMSFLPASYTREVERGDTTIFSHVLTNTGSMTDTYYVAHANSQGWNVTYPATLLDLAPGEAAAVPVEVEVPPGASAAQVGTTWVTATSDFNSAVTAAVEDVIHVVPVVGIEMTPYYSNTLLPGEVITYTHRVTNTGDALDTVALSIVVDSFNWATLLPTDPYSVPLGPGVGHTFVVSVVVAPAAPAGLANYAVIRATSGLSPTVWATVTDTVIAKATVGTRYVRTNGTDLNNNCTQSNAPCRTIARAIGQASLGDEVRIATGAYPEADINVNNSIRISGGWSSDFGNQNGGETVIDADGRNRIFNIAPGSSVEPVFDLLTLSNGSTSAVGGAVWVQDFARPRFTRLTFQNNSAPQGGAVYLGQNVSVVISQTTLANNSASRNGGAIYQRGGELLLVQSRLQTNTAGATQSNDGGGGIHVLAGVLIAQNNLFDGNSSGQGGGALLLHGGQALLDNNTLNGNSAATRGGGAYNLGASLRISNTILANNTAAGTGGAIYHEGGATAMAYIDFWNNSAPQSNVGLGTAAIMVDPLFADVDFRLSPDSLVIDAGDPASQVFNDFEGDPRPVDQGFDLGWDELAGCSAMRGDIIYGGIQEAIDAGGPPLILVSGRCRGVHTMVVNGQTVSQTVHLSETLTIRGGYNALFNNDPQQDYVPTYVDPQGRGRAFYFLGGAAPLVENLIVENGDASGLGGGPANRDAGGAIYNQNSSVTLRRVSVYSSTAEVGGAFYSQGGQPVFAVVTPTTVIPPGQTNPLMNVLAGNSAADGGAVYLNGGNMTLAGSLLGNNSAGNGGGVFVQGGVLAAQNSVLVANTATNGGAIYSQAATGSLLHLTIYSNTATLGGGVYVAAGGLVIHSNIFQSNQGASGPAIHVAGGSADVDYNYYHAHAGNPVFGAGIGDHSINSPIPPGLVNPPGGDFHLADAAPAEDGGNPAHAVGTDFELQLRPSNQGPDMGADEIAGCYARVRSSGDVYGNIQVALDQALLGDWVDVAGRCTGVHSYNAGGSLGVISQTVHLTKNVSLQGGWDVGFTAIVSQTTLDAQGLGRVLYVAPAITSTVNGFRMLNGAALGPGQAGNGGAVYLDTGAAVVLENNDIAQSMAPNGGAVYAAGGPAAFHLGNRIYDNQATNGGAIYAAGAVSLTNNFIYSNTATNGGAFYNAAGNSTFWHNSVVENAAGNNGGGVYVLGGSPSIRGNIIMNNAAAVAGGGAYGAGGSASLGFNDFYLNTPGNFGGTIGNGGPGSLSVDPEFTNLAAFDLTITRTSPILDRGDPATTLVIDYEKDIRPSHQGFDMGADEVGGCYARLVRTGVIYGSVQRAVDAAVDGDLIQVDGICIGVSGRVSSSTAVSQTVYIDKDLQLGGSWDSGLVGDEVNATLDPLGRGRAIYVEVGATVVISQMTMTSGNATVTGFGHGGAVYNRGVLTLTSVLLVGNSAVNGGGFYNTSSGASALQFSELAGNVASGSGGAIYNQSGTLRISENNVRDNVANNGAGIYLNSSAAVHNNFISGNEASQNGGGLHGSGSSSPVWHNTIVLNEAAGGSGGGIYFSSGAPIIRNNIVDRSAGTGIHVVAGNPDIDYNNVYLSSGMNYGGIATPGAGDISVEPIYLVGPPGAYFLAENSPGIDQGDPDSPIPFDIQEDIRPGNAGFDMGADEDNSCLVRVVDPAGINSRIFGALQDAIDYAELNNFYTVQIARGECRGVRQDSVSGAWQVGYVREDLNFVGSLRRLDFSDPGDYFNPDVGTVTTIIDAQSQGRVIYVAPGAQPTFDQLAFVNGNAFVAGGGLRGGGVYAAGEVDLHNTYICQSQAQDGGGYYGTSGSMGRLMGANAAGAPLLLDAPANVESIISGVGVNIGACVTADVVENPDGTIVLPPDYDFFDGNSATGDGGAVYNEGDLTLTGVVLSANSAGDQGGAIYNSAQLEIRNALLALNNAAGHGGGLYNSTGQAATVVNGIFYANSSLGEGGAVYSAGDLSAYHNTIRDNEAAGSGGGVRFTGSQLILNSSIVYSNTAGAAGGGLSASSGNLAFNNFYGNSPDDSTIGIGAGSIQAEPVFLGIWSLDYTSPDIDKADPSLIEPPLSITFDAALDVRPDGGTLHTGLRQSDIGADEWVKDFGCLITPASQSRTIAPGGVTQYVSVITNVGNPPWPDMFSTGFTDTITITLASSSRNWATLDGGSPITVTLAWPESTVVTITAVVPVTATAGMQDITILRCQSGAMPERSSTATRMTTAGSQRAVVIEPDYVDSALPGDVITYTHTVTNLGNITDTYQVFANSGPAYASAAVVRPDGSIMTETITLGPGQSTQVLLQVTILPDARGGEIATPGAVVRSRTDATISDAALNTIAIGYIPGTRHVAREGGSDTTNNCTLPENPCATIQHAVNQALDGDTVLLAAGVYSDAVTSAAGAHNLHLYKSVDVRGGHTAADLFSTVQPITNAVVLDGEFQHRVVYVEPGVTAMLANLFLRNGQVGDANGAGGYGGGVYNAGGSLTLDGVWLWYNQAQYGGGLYQASGALRLHSTVVAYNTNLGLTIGAGGGLYVADGTTVIENGTFANNQPNTVPSEAPALVGEGGGLYQPAGALTISNTIFYENQAAVYSAFFGPPATTNDYNLYFWFVNPGLPTNVPTGTHSLTADPLFSDAYYHLDEASPAREAGTAVNHSMDFDHQPRTQGTAEDIGADEFLLLPDFLFVPTYQEAIVDPGQVHTYTHILTNTGEFTDSYALEASHQTTGGTGWGYALDPQLITNLAIGDSVTVTLVVTGGSPGYQDTTIITATSQSPLPLSRTVMDVTRVSQIAGVAFESPESGSGVPGQDVSYLHVLTNTGNGPDTYSVTVTSTDPAGWSVLVSPATTGILLPGETAAITATVAIPADALSGTVHTAEITAVSQADPLVSASLTDTTTVLPVYGLSLTPDRTTTVPDDTTVVYTHTLASQSNAADLVNLAVASTHGWPIGLSDASVALPPFGSQVVTVTLIVPAGVGGEVHMAWITATSTISPSVQASAVDTTIVELNAGVVVEPDYFRVVDPGSVVTYVHTITNTGNTADYFAIAAVSSQGWLTALEPATIALLPGASGTITAVVSVPAAAAPGSVDQTLVTATSLANPAVQDSASDVTRVIQNHSLLFAPDRTQTTPPGMVVTYTHTVTNTGDGQDTFGFTAVSLQGWTATTPADVTLDPASSAEVQVSLVVPSGAAGLTDVMTVTASSVISPTAASAYVVDTTIVTDTGGTGGVALEPDNSGVVLSGQTIVYQHTVTNTGSAGDSYALSVSSSQGWPVTVSPASATLGPGASTAVTVTVTAPGGTVSGTLDVSTVTAYSTLNPGVSDQATDTTTATDTAQAGVLFVPDNFGSGIAGAAVIYQHTLTNLGNGQDTFTLSGSSTQGWTIDIAPPSVTLLANESSSVAVTVMIPAGAATGAVDLTTVTAVSTVNPAVFDTVVDTTTVLAPPVYRLRLPVIVYTSGGAPPPPPPPTPTATPTTPPVPCNLIPPAPANPPGVDLIVTNITVSPNPPIAGQPATVSVTIHNQGQTGVQVGNNFYVDFYDNPNPEPPGLFQQGMVAWGAQGGYMTPGASRTYSAVFVFGSGAHRLYAQVDTDNTVVESIEGNNLYGCLALNVAAAEAPEQETIPETPPAEGPRATPTPEPAIMLPPPIELAAPEPTPTPVP